MANLLDLMTEEDRQLVKTWAEERRFSKHKRDIPLALFTCAQLGYYYGWGAVVDFRRGYHEGIKPDGTPQRLAFTFEDAVGLIKAAEKVNYRIKLDEGRINAASTVSSYDKTYAKNNAEYVNKIADEVNG